VYTTRHRVYLAMNRVYPATNRVYPATEGIRLKVKISMCFTTVSCECIRPGRQKNRSIAEINENHKKHNGKQKGDDQWKFTEILKVVVQLFSASVDGQDDTNTTKNQTWLKFIRRSKEKLENNNRCKSVETLKEVRCKTNGSPYESEEILRATQCFMKECTRPAENALLQRSSCSVLTKCQKHKNLISESVFARRCLRPDIDYFVHVDWFGWTSRVSQCIWLLEHMVEINYPD
jgi:hypothetical protein